VEEAVAASQITLSAQEIEMIEALARRAGVDTRGTWEKPMV